MPLPRTVRLTPEGENPFAVWAQRLPRADPLTVVGNTTVLDTPALLAAGDELVTGGHRYRVLAVRQHPHNAVEAVVIAAGGYLRVVCWMRAAVRVVRPRPSRAALPAGPPAAITG